EYHRTNAPSAVQHNLAAQHRIARWTVVALRGIGNGTSTGRTSHDTGREPRPQSRRAGERGVRQIVAVRQNRSRARTRGSAGGAHAAGAEFGPYRPGRGAGYVGGRPTPAAGSA